MDEPATDEERSCALIIAMLERPSSVKGLLELLVAAEKHGQVEPWASMANDFRRAARIAQKLAGLGELAAYQEAEQLMSVCQYHGAFTGEHTGCCLHHKLLNK